jgi:8-oxo-dGTP diphosphatase
MRSAYGAKEIGISEHEIGTGEHPVTIVVDVANVMGSRPDGWWRDRAGAAVRLHAELVRLAASGRAVPPGETDPPDFVMVLEGAAKAAAGRLSAASPAGRAPGEARPPEAVRSAGDAGPGGAGPGDAEPRGSTPGDATPGEAEPGDAAPGDAAPGDAAPGDAAPGDAAPGGARVGEVRVVLAPGSGDDAIVAVVRKLPGHRVVVTADRELRERCVAAGATTMRPSWLLGLLRP